MTLQLFWVFLNCLNFVQIFVLFMDVFSSPTGSFPAMFDTFAILWCDFSKVGESHQTGGGANHHWIFSAFLLSPWSNSKEKTLPNGCLGLRWVVGDGSETMQQLPKLPFASQIIWSSILPFLERGIFEPNPCFVFLRLSAFESVGLTHQQPDAYWVRPGIFGGPKSSQESPIPTRWASFK